MCHRHHHGRCCRSETAIITDVLHDVDDEDDDADDDVHEREVDDDSDGEADFVLSSNLFGYYLKNHI